MPSKKRALLHSLYPAEYDIALISIFDEAVRKGSSLHRPFEEHEVLGRKWREKYFLALNWDPRFIAVQAETETQPRLWIVDEPVYLPLKTLLSLPYQRYCCTSTVHVTRARSATTLFTTQGIVKEVVAGDLLYWDEQWKSWGWRKCQEETFLRRYAYQGPTKAKRVFLYQHAHPYWVAQKEERFTLHSGSELQVSEGNGG